MNHEEPPADFLHHLVLPLRIGLQLLQQVVVPVYCVVKILLPDLHHPKSTSSAYLLREKKLELVLLVSTTL